MVAARGLVFAGAMALLGCNAILGNEEGELGAPGGGGAAGGGGTAGAAGGGGTQPETCWALLDAKTATTLAGSDRVKAALSFGTTGTGNVFSTALLGTDRTAVSGFAQGVTAQTGTADDFFVGVVDLATHVLERVRGIPQDPTARISALGASGDLALVMQVAGQVTLDSLTVTSSDPKTRAVFRLDGTTLTAKSKATIDAASTQQPIVVSNPAKGFVIGPAEWDGRALVTYNDDLSERAVTAFGNQSATSTAVATAPDGSVYATFRPTSSSLQMSGGSTENLGTLTGSQVLVKYSVDLQYQWHRVLSGIDEAFPAVLAAGSPGVAVSWRTEDQSVGIAGKTLEPCGGITSTSVLTLFEPDGTRSWTRIFGGTARLLALDKSGVTAVNDERLTVSGKDIYKQSGTVPFHVSPSGDLQWAQTIGATGAHPTTVQALAPSGILLGGAYTGVMQIPTPIDSQGDQRGFLLWLQ